MLKKVSIILNLLRELYKLIPICIILFVPVEKNMSILYFLGKYATDLTRQFKALSFTMEV